MLDRRVTTIFSGVNFDQNFVMKLDLSLWKLQPEARFVGLLKALVGISWSFTDHLGKFAKGTL